MKRKRHCKLSSADVQTILEAPSTHARLQLILEALIEQRKRLQALAALRAAQEDA